MTLSRRALLRGVLAGSAGFTSFGRDFWTSAYAADTAVAGPGPYGSLDGREPDENGLILPEGFTSRVVGTTGEAVPGTEYDWHTYPDGGCTFPTEDGGWVYVSNSEDDPGGASAIRFDPDGEIVDAYRICNDTRRNCAGGPTPWGTWLTCEEFDDGDGEAGTVWECDPLGEAAPVQRAAMGAFAHEAVAVDPDGQVLYLTEDQPDGLFYRFTPEAWPAIDRGTLEAAVVGTSGFVTWVEVPDPTSADGPLRSQHDAFTTFDGGEGCWFDDGGVYFTTKGDGSVRRLDTQRQKIDLVFDPEAAGETALGAVDNITAAPNGDLFIAEDGDNMELVIITTSREVAPFVRVVGHDDSEMCGPSFSPDGTRLYFSSQRGTGGKDQGRGFTYEVTGPFRTDGTGGGMALLPGASEPGSGDGGGGGGLPVAGIVGGGVVVAGAATAGAIAFRRRGGSTPAP